MWTLSLSVPYHECTQTLHAEATIQLDVEKLEVNSPDLALATATSGSHIAGHSSETPDVEMGELAMLKPQDEHVGPPIMHDQTDAHLSNPDR